MDDVIKKLLGGILDSLDELKTKIDDQKKSDSFEGSEFNVITHEIKNEIENIKNTQFQTKLTEQDRRALIVVSKEIEKISKSLSQVHVEELNSNISRLQNITILKKHEYSKSFFKYSYWLNGIAILAMFGTVIYANWWIKSSTKEANLEMKKAKEIIQTYEGFPEPVEWNWYVNYYNSFNKMHPKDSEIWRETNPYPSK